MPTPFEKCIMKYNITIRRIILLLFYLGISFFVLPVFAQENTSQQTNDKAVVEKTTTSASNEVSIPSYFPTKAKTVSPQRNIGITDFLTSFLFLAIIVILIFLMAWLFKRSGLSPGAGNQVIKIVSAVHLGQKEKIALIEVGNQQLLIGISPGNIQKLMILDNPVKVDEKSTKINTIPFSTQLFNSLKKEKNAN